MAGALIKVIPKTTYDWAAMSAGPSVAAAIGEPIRVIEYADAIFVVRVHSVNVAGLNQLSFGLYPDGYLASSGTAFLGIDPLVSVGLNGIIAPCAIIQGTPALSEYVSVGMIALRGDLATGISATVSIDVCLKSSDDVVPRDPAAIGTLFGAMPPEIRNGLPALPMLGRLFAPWGLDPTSVRFEVQPLPGGLIAQTKSEDRIALSPLLSAKYDEADIMATLGHELTHICQMRKLGIPTATVRAAREEAVHGRTGMRVIPEELRSKWPAALDPVDPKFTLEAIAGRMSEVARSLVPKKKSCGKGGCNCG